MLFGIILVLGVNIFNCRFRGKKIMNKDDGK